MNLSHITTLKNDQNACLQGRSVLPTLQSWQSPLSPQALTSHTKFQKAGLLRQAAMGHQPKDFLHSESEIPYEKWDNPSYGEGQGASLLPDKTPNNTKRRLFRQ